MARISINKASLDFNISRNTLYKHIKQGKITKDSEGKLDTSDLIRLYGTHVNGQQETTGSYLSMIHKTRWHPHQQRLRCRSG